MENIFCVENFQNLLFSRGTKVGKMLTLAHERYTADALAVCRAHRGLPDGFLLFREVGAPLNRFKPSSKYFTDRYKAVLLLWIFYFFLSCLLCLCSRLFIYVPCCHRLGKG